MSERTSGTHPRCLFYGGTVIKEQPLSQGSLLPIPSKQERERERERDTLVGSGHVSPEENLF